MKNTFEESELIKQYAKDFLKKSFSGLKIKEVLWFNKILRKRLSESLSKGDEFVS